VTTDHPIDDPDDPPPRPLNLAPWPILVTTGLSLILTVSMFITLLVISNTVRHNLREYLLRRGALQEAVARKVGMSQAEIDAIVRREREQEQEDRR
jgi:hypothetical protein